jgi:hypothetical protein
MSTLYMHNTCNWQALARYQRYRTGKGTQVNNVLPLSDHLRINPPTRISHNFTSEAVDKARQTCPLKSQQPCLQDVPAIPLTRTLRSMKIRSCHKEQPPRLKVSLLAHPCRPTEPVSSVTLVGMVRHEDIDLYLVLQPDRTKKNRVRQGRVDKIGMVKLVIGR